MIGAIYKNRLWYYTLLKDFLGHTIKAYPFRRKFMSQRNNDIDENKVTGFSDYYRTKQWTSDELKFRNEYFNKLYNYAPSDDVNKLLNEYVDGAKKYDIGGELFFSGIFDDLSVNIRDFHARNQKEAKVAGWEDSWDEFGFPELSKEDYKEGYHIDETELRRKLLEKFKILEQNKERWI